MNMECMQRIQLDCNLRVDPNKLGRQLQARVEAYLRPAAMMFQNQEADYIQQTMKIRIVVVSIWMGENVSMIYIEIKG